MILLDALVFHNKTRYIDGTHFSMNKLSRRYIYICIICNSMVNCTYTNRAHSSYQFVTVICYNNYGKS